MSFLRTALRVVPKQRATLIAPRSVAWARQSWAMQRAAYSASAGLSRSDIESRILAVLKDFEKVDGSKVRRLLFQLYDMSYIITLQLTASSSFAEDLGLDSLDSVEVVMAVEEASFIVLYPSFPLSSLN